MSEDEKLGLHPTRRNIWRLVLLTVIGNWTINTWMGRESLSWSSDFVNQVSNYFLFLSPFVFIFSLWRLSPPGMYRQLSLGTLICVLIAAGWLVSLTIYWTHGLNLVATNLNNKHYVLAGGRLVDVLYTDCGALGGSCTLLSREPMGPFLYFVIVRNFSECSNFEVTSLLDGSVKITTNIEPYKKATYDIDEFLAGAVGK